MLVKEGSCYIFVVAYIYSLASLYLSIKIYVDVTVIDIQYYDTSKVRLSWFYDFRNFHTIQ
jgi:hypothetical protein